MSADQEPRNAGSADSTEVQPCLSNGKELSPQRGPQKESPLAISQDMAEQATNMCSAGTDRKVAQGQDSTAMTIEFLRARLLSERSVSKAAKERVQQLTKKVLELEQALETQVAKRKQAEEAIKDALVRLQAAGHDLECGELSVFLQNALADHGLEAKVGEESLGDFSLLNNSSSAMRENFLNEELEGKAKENLTSQNQASDSDDDKLYDGKENGRWEVPASADPGDNSASKSADSIQSPSCSPRSDSGSGSFKKVGRSCRTFKKKQTSMAAEEHANGTWNQVLENMEVLTDLRNQEGFKSEFSGWMNQVVDMFETTKSSETNVNVRSSEENDSISHPQYDPAGNQQVLEKDDKQMDKSQSDYMKALENRFVSEEKAQTLWEKQYHARSFKIRAEDPEFPHNNGEPLDPGSSQGQDVVPQNPSDAISQQATGSVKTTEVPVQEDPVINIMEPGSTHAFYFSSRESLPQVSEALCMPTSEFKKEIQNSIYMIGTPKTELRARQFTAETIGLHLGENLTGGEVYATAKESDYKGTMFESEKKEDKPDVSEVHNCDSPEFHTKQITGILNKLDITPQHISAETNGPEKHFAGSYAEHQPWNMHMGSHNIHCTSTSRATHLNNSRMDGIEMEQGYGSKGRGTLEPEPYMPRLDASGLSHLPQRRDDLPSIYPNQDVKNRIWMDYQRSMRRDSMAIQNSTYQHNFGSGAFPHSALAGMRETAYPRHIFEASPDLDKRYMNRPLMDDRFVPRVEPMAEKVKDSWQLAKCSGDSPEDILHALRLAKQQILESLGPVPNQAPEQPMQKAMHNLEAGPRIPHGYLDTGLLRWQHHNQASYIENTDKACFQPQQYALYSDPMGRINPAAHVLSRSTDPLSVAHESAHTDRINVGNGYRFF